MIVGLAFAGRQAVEIDFDKSQLLEPVDGTCRERENARHAELHGLLDQIRHNLAPHAQVLVDRIRSDGRDLRLAFAEIVKSAAGVNDIVNRIHDEIAMLREQVFIAAFDENAFLHQRLHQAQDVADVVGLHGSYRLVVVIPVDHRADAEVREDLSQDRSLHPPIDNVRAFGSFAAGCQREREVLQVGIGVIGIEIQDLFGFFQTEPRDAPVAVLYQAWRQLESRIHEAVAVGDEEQLLRLQRLRDRECYVVAGQVVGLTGGIPTDAWKNRNHALIEKMLERLLENLLDAAGILKVHAIDHTDAASPYEVSDHGIGLERREQSHQPVGYVEGRHPYEWNCVLCRDPNAIPILALDVVFLEHGIDPFARSRNQNDLDAGSAQHSKILHKLRKVRRVEDWIVDLQDDGLTVEPILVIKDFPDQVDLFPVLDLVHAHTLAHHVLRRNVRLSRKGPVSGWTPAGKRSTP